MKSTLLALLLIIAIALLGLAAMAVGSSGVGPAAILDGLSDVERMILFQLRMPRLLLALLAGAALSASGALMQTFFRNPLAEPYITGVSAGGALGAVAVTSMHIMHPLAIGAGALLGGGAITAALYAFALRATRSSLSILLLGLALGTLCGALVWVVLLGMGPAGSSEAIGWLLGRVSTTGYGEVTALAVATAIGIALALSQSTALDTLLLGEEKAATLGLNVLASRQLILGAAALLAAASVAFCGVIAFVGLMVPHVMRIAVGSTHARLLPLCMLGGSALVLGIDLLSRVIAPPSEFPLTVLTSLIGAPFFIFVLLRSREVAV
ncbi:MAG: iron ABC transporter permease [bacterium]|nr:iron ABC transporter permease [bacterium]